MKFPKKLKIGGHWYDVDMEYVFRERWDRWAFHDVAVKKIMVSHEDEGRARALSGRVVSLVHEVLHALDRLTGQEIFAGQAGEAKVEALSEAVFQFLTDNGYLRLDSRETEKERKR